jgi:FtsZ-binding cell division protein ZapB
MKMSDHDKIELPPLPPLRIVPSVEPVDYPEIAQALMDYARAAIEADRQRRGEPVGWPLASPEDADKGWTLDYRFIEQVERAARQRTDYTTSMEATEQVLITAAEVLGAPQPAETVQSESIVTDIIERLRIESRREPHEPIWRDAIDEIEALRAEVAEWKRVAVAQAELQGEAEERAERLVDNNKALQAECEELRTALIGARANDRQAMAYLNEVRALVGGDDFPDMVERVAKLQAERDKLREEVLRLRVAMAKAAQRADDWPDSNDDPSDVLSDCASILFDALDYRHTSA